MISNALTVLAAAEPSTDAEVEDRKRQDDDRKWYALLKTAVALDPARLEIHGHPNGKDFGGLNDTKHQFYVTRHDDGFTIGTSLRAPLDFETKVRGRENLEKSVRALLRMLKLCDDRRDRIQAIADETRDQIVEIVTEAFGRRDVTKVTKQLNRVEEALNVVRH